MDDKAPELFNFEENWAELTGKNNWISANKRLPAVDKNVILWRYNKRRYTIAKIEIAPDDDAGLFTKKADFTPKTFWRSSYGNQLKIDERDYWCSFEYLQTTEIFE